MGDFRNIAWISMVNLVSRSMVAVKQIDGILFDMDGTLIESIVAWYHTLIDGCDHFGTPHFTLDHYKTCFGQGQQENVDQFYPGHTVEELDAFCNITFPKHTDKVFELEEAYQVVEAAMKHTNGRCFIVTNSPPEVVDQLMERKETLPLLHIFGRERIFASGEVLKDGTKILPKPKTQMIEQAAKRLGVSLENCMMVGDSRFDVMTGKGGNCAITVGINVDGGDYKIAAIKELIPIIESLPKNN